MSENFNKLNMEYKPITYLYYESGQYKAILICIWLHGTPPSWGGGGGSEKPIVSQFLCQAHFLCTFTFFNCTVASELHVGRNPKFIVL